MSKISLRNLVSGWNKIKRFGFFIPASNLFLNYGNSLFPQIILNAISNKRNDLIERKILRTIEESDIITYPRLPSDYETGNSDKIWVLWLQGMEQMPLIPRMCLDSIRKHSNGHEVVFLSIDNLSKYCVLPERILNLYKKGNITAAHMSDIIRVALLSRHGGFWIDSTVYLTDDIPEDIFKRDLYSMKSEPEGFYVSKCRWAGFCFFMKSSFILPRMLNEMLLRYWERQDWLIDYFMLDYLIDIAAKKSIIVSEALLSIPHNNPNLHSLASLLAKDYDEKLFRSLTKDTSFFKLNWKLYSDEQLSGNSNNFYTKLAKIAR